MFKWIIMFLLMGQIIVTGFELELLRDCGPKARLTMTEKIVIKTTWPLISVVGLAVMPFSQEPYTTTKARVCESFGGAA